MTRLPKPTGREYLDLPEPSAQGHEAGIYIHFPFCRYLCTYCDFDKFAGIERLVGAYVDATVEQIAGSPAARATSLYVGGGTPSIMSPGQADRLIGACRDRFDLPREAEATIEANPTDMSAERLEGFQKSGYNRLSVGIQSTNDRLLRLLGRRHSFGDAEAAIKSARAAGFDNVSVDLIYGVPMQDAEMWARTLDAVVGWGWSTSPVTCLP